MTKVVSRAKSLGKRVCDRLFGYLPNKRGNVAAIVALSMVPLAGVMGMAAEGSNWFLNQRAQQNGADAAVVAAANMALNDYYANCLAGSCSWGTTFPNEGKAVAAQYGYTNAGNVTVSITNGVLCPTNVNINLGSGGSNTSCFQALISKPFPLFLTHLLGFNGNYTLSGQHMELITATAIAGPVSEPQDICLFTKGAGPYESNGQKYAMTFHGSSGINLEGCSVGSNGGMDCTGNTTLNSPYGVVGDGSTDKSGCGYLTYTESSAIVDPDAGLASNLTSAPYKDNCGGSYPGTTTSAISASSGTSSAYAVIQVCGNLTLSSDFAITGNEVIEVENGYLDLAGHTLSTSGTGAGVTVIFSQPNYADAKAIVGDNNGGGETNGEGFIYDSVGGGTINISSTVAGSGVFAGVTVYQDPTPFNNAGTIESYNSLWDGNSAKVAWSLSGMYYMPDANLVLHGATDKASDGYNCFDMVINSLVSDGGNSFSMFAHPLSQCGQQGTAVPQINGFRYALVG